MNRLIIFDLDGTLTESKTKVTPEIVQAISDLQEDNFDVAVISGCAYEQFQEQFIPGFHQYDYYKWLLYLLPTCGAQLYEYCGIDGGNWQQVYCCELLLKEKVEIYQAWKSATIPEDFDQKIYGEIAEDRKSQITFSMCGQDAPLHIKEKYDPNQDRRNKIAEAMRKYLPDYEVKLGGTTSIDVTKKGIDKAFGVRKIMERLQMDKKDVVFIGDALYENGNDYPVKTLGIKCIETSGPEETLKIIENLER